MSVRGAGSLIFLALAMTGSIIGDMGWMSAADGRAWDWLATIAVVVVIFASRRSD